MTFKYKWSDKTNGNFAIRKRGEKGKEAGKELEPKRNQTSNTHFFIYVDKKETDNYYNALQKITPILKTITYDYIQRGTDKKGTPYLSKKDIEDVFQNIEKYKGKTITIETPPSKKKQQEDNKLLNDSLRKCKKALIEIYDADGLKDIMSLLIENLSNANELKNRENRAKEKIKTLNKEIKKINDDLIEYRNAINNQKEEYEKDVYDILKKELKDFPFNDNNKKLNFTNLLNVVLYYLAKKEMRNRKANIIQQRYRDRKKEMEGKPKQPKGRPRKTES